MSSRGTVLLGWLGATAGLVVLYSAYKNESPLSVLGNTLGGTPTRPIGTSSGSQASGFMSGSVTDPTTFVGSGAIGPSGGKVASERAKRIQARELTPTLIPIPTQPTLRMDYEAVNSLMKVQQQIGRTLPATGTMRSYEEQARGHASDPSRFAEPGHSGHEVGIAIDFDTGKVDLEASDFLQAMVSNGWFRSGRSGIMHWSYGVAA